MNPNQNESTSHRTHRKVTPDHCRRLAYIYVRQSSLKQVQQNQESQMNQYRLRKRAVQLGWPDERVRVIDWDQGLSGRESQARTGFQELVTEISLGHVGIVFGYEVSRLARNNRDWYHLLDLAAMFGTLIADNDGVYDPRLYNDRLLLGLKGTMSEAELHLLRQRLDEGRLNQVRRGAYHQKLPAGLIRPLDGLVVKDPDDQVRHVIELVFAKFEELHSINKVVRYLRQHQILLPRRQTSGPQAGELLWKVANESAIYDMLQNPAYAGAFAYGRKQTEKTRQKPGQHASGRIHKPMSEWLHLQQDVYPAYISWEQYLANQKQLRQNGLRFRENRQKAQGIVRTGPGLLQGMPICGHCGYHMQTVYKHTPRYVCRGLSRTTDAPSDCTSVRAPVVDEVVVQAFFEAIQPAQLDALEAILAQQQREQERLECQWQDKLSRAQYEAGLARRQYDAVDPDNRLVAAELERRWETKLRQLQQTEEEHRHFQQTPLPHAVPPQLREMFHDVSGRLPELWPALTNPQKKELLRSLISHVIIKRPVPDRIEVRIVWISGCYWDKETWTPIHCEKDVSRYDEMVARIQELWQQGYGDEEIAGQLTVEGFHSARSPHVPPVTVQKIRLEHQWYLPREQVRGHEEVAGYLTVQGLAKRLETNISTIYRFIYKEVIPPENVSQHVQTGTYLIRPTAQLMTVLQQRLAKNKTGNGLATTSNSSVAVTKTDLSDNDKELPHVVESTCFLPVTSVDKKCSPTVQMNQLFADGDTNREAVCAVGSPEWFIWLDSATKFRYHTTQTIHMAHGYSRSMRPISVRKEKRRHGFFWCAYLRTHGRLYKRYVGRSQDLTLEKLDEIAATLNEIW